MIPIKKEQEVIQLYRERTSKSQIAKRVGVSRTKVIEIIKKCEKNQRKEKNRTDHHTFVNKVRADTEESKDLLRTFIKTIKDGLQDEFTKKWILTELNEYELYSKEQLESMHDVGFNEGRERLKEELELDEFDDEELTEYVKALKQIKFEKIKNRLGKKDIIKFLSEYLNDTLSLKEENSSLMNFEAELREKSQKLEEGIIFLKKQKEEQLKEYSKLKAFNNKITNEIENKKALLKEINNKEHMQLIEKGKNIAIAEIYDPNNIGFWIKKLVNRRSRYMQISLVEKFLS